MQGYSLPAADIRQLWNLTFYTSSSKQNFPPALRQISHFTKSNLGTHQWTHTSERLYTTLRSVTERLFHNPT